MNQYNYIVNPKTGRQVSIYKKLGTSILKKYLETSNMSGGFLSSPKIGNIKRKAKTFTKHGAIKFSNDLGKEALNLGNELHHRKNEYLQSQSGKELQQTILRKGQSVKNKVSSSINAGIENIIQQGVENMNEATLISVCKFCNAEATKKKCTEINALLKKRAEEAKKKVTEKLKAEEEKIKKKLEEIKKVTQENIDKITKESEEQMKILQEQTQNEHQEIENSLKETSEH